MVRDEGLIPGLEDPLEEGMETHSSILAWEIPWTEEPSYSPWGCKESGMTEVTWGESESHSVVSKYLRPPWTIQSMEFSRPEYWSG